MIKLIATDLDGTLLREDKSFNKEFYDKNIEQQKRELVNIQKTYNNNKNVDKKQ